MVRCLFVAIAAAVAFGATVDGARADGAKDLGAEAWARGVSPDDRAAATRLYSGGNDLYADGRFAEALRLYERALALWDHPKILFNAARALAHVGKPLSAYRQLRRAMIHGPEGVGAAKHSEGQMMLALLRGQLAEVSVSCSTAGAVVSIDGVELLRGTGTAAVTLRPGRHQLVAEAPGKQRVVKRLDLAGGASESVSIALVAPPPPPPTVTTQFERRWPRWQPWSVATAGALLLVGGGVAAVLSEENFDRFDDALANEPGCQSGCTDAEIPTSIAELRDRGKRQRTAAIALGAVGTAVVVTGILMIVKNDVRESQTLVGASVTAESIGLAFGGRF